MQELEKYTIPELLLHIMQRLYDTDKVKNRARFGMLNAYIRQFERAHIQAAAAIIMPARFGKYVKPSPNTGDPLKYEIDITPHEVYEIGEVISETGGYFTDAPVDDSPPIESMDDEVAPATTKRGRKKTPGVRRKKNNNNEDECCV